MTGRVQGVFFRAKTKETAIKLGLKVFVMNQDDGSVLIEIEGDSQDIKSFENWCQHGPALAKVENLTKEEILRQNHKSFIIKK